MAEQLLIENWGLAYSPDDAETKPMVESTEQNGALYIEGIFMQAEVVNRNGRKYPKRVLEKAVNKYIREQVKTSQALGELNHPNRPNIDPSEAAIRITEMWWDGNNVMGKARIVEGDGGAGDKTAALIRAGWVPGVSSRGLGSVKEVNGINEVQDGFRLTVGVDVVWGPSAPSAYVKPVTESRSTMTESHQPNVNMSKLDALVQEYGGDYKPKPVEKAKPKKKKVSMKENFLEQLKNKHNDKYGIEND